MQQMAQGLATLGRGQDSMLVHMTPGEVGGLQALAMRHGGSLTINPQTGLPEAGFLSALLPIALGLALGPAGLGMSSLAAAGTVGALGALATNSLGKGLAYGFGAYGGAGLGQGLTEIGVEQANALARPELAAGSQATTTTGNAAADAAFNFAKTNRQAAIDAAVPVFDDVSYANPGAGVNYADTANNLTGFGDDPRLLTRDSLGVPSTQAAVATPADLNRNPIDNRLSYNLERPSDFVANPYSREGVGYMQSQGSTGADIAQSARESAVNAAPMPAYSPATQEALARGPTGNAFEGVRQLGTKEGIKNLGGKLGFSGVAGLAAPLISSALTPAAFTPPVNKPANYYNTSYNPPKYNPATGMYEPASYGSGSYYNAAQGGTVGYARGGEAEYPLTGDKVTTGGLGGPGEKLQYPRDIYGDDSGAGLFDDKAGKGPYSDTAGKGIHTNASSGVEAMFAKTSPATLAKFKKAKSAAVQAAAIKELHKRANAVDPYAEDTTSAAQGGLMELNTYAAGGTLLRGLGDGMSDSIPAVIRGQRPQRAALADGEFVIPADVVSHLGNGSTEAGSKRLYSMMDKVRRARTGSPKQGRQIDPARFMPV